MKRIILLLLVSLMALPAYTQELSAREKRKLAREMKKEEEAKALEESAIMVAAMIENATFVLEATQLRDKQGQSIIVTPTLNFVAVDSTNGVLQVGDDAGVGPNGVGGVTVEGNVAEYKFTKNDRNGTYNVTYFVQSPVGTYDVRISAFRNGRAEATLSNATWGGRITYSGQLIPPMVSRVYKGMSL